MLAVVQPTCVEGCRGRSRIMQPVYQPTCAVTVLTCPPISDTLSLGRFEYQASLNYADSKPPLSPRGPRRPPARCGGSRPRVHDFFVRVGYAGCAWSSQSCRDMREGWHFSHVGGKDGGASPMELHATSPPGIRLMHPRITPDYPPIRACGGFSLGQTACGSFHIPGS